MPIRAKLWRIVAGLMCLGAAADLVFGVLDATGVLTTVSVRTAYITQWIPPATERLWPTTRLIGRFRGHAAAVAGVLMLITGSSVLLAIGLWKTKRWAAWITTGFMLFIMLPAAYEIVVLIRHVSVSNLVVFGLLPALIWSAIYIVLLWIDRIADGLRLIVDIIKSLRRERVPLE